MPVRFCINALLFSMHTQNLPLNNNLAEWKVSGSPEPTLARLVSFLEGNKGLRGLNKTSEKTNCMLVVKTKTPIMYPHGAIEYQCYFSPLPLKLCIRGIALRQTFLNSSIR